MIRVLTRGLVLLSLLCAAAIACAEGPAAAGEPIASAWARGNHVLLGVTQQRIGFSAQWRFQRSASGDVLLELEEMRAGRARAGALLLVSNAVLLARDITLARGRELDAFNGPLLMLQLALRLLERAAPGGPESIRRNTAIDLVERERALEVSGLGANGEFFAPWQVRGTLAPGGDGRIAFEIEFVSASHARNGLPYETRIAGIWQNASPPVQLPDAMALHGWRGFRIKPTVRSHGEINTLGVGTSAAMGFANLGEVRRRALEWRDEGARRARWQCS